MGGVTLDRLATRWQWALDRADEAADAARHLPDPVEHGPSSHERQATADLLRAVAALHPGAPVPWLAPTRVTPQLLGLPARTEACIFDLDGVLTDSGALHAQAWREVLDDFLLGRSSPEHRLAPFDLRADYAAHLDGRLRADGVRTFLASRGIAATQLEVATLARRKAERLRAGLDRRGVAALDGARRYLAAAGHAHLGRGVVSASTATMPMLQLAQLESLVEVTVDAAVMRERALRPRPAPDILLAACARLGADPAHTVTFTHSDAGVAAGRVCEMGVVRVGVDVPSLAALLDRRLKTG